MSTRFIKKRVRKVFPIGHARLRESHLLHGKNRQSRIMNYPLYKSFNETYNFENLRDCLNCWNEYSCHLDSNVKNITEILKVMDKHEASQQDLREATRIICNNILDYLPNVDKYKPLFESLNSERLDETKTAILNKIFELSECDRILENYKKLDENLHFHDFYRKSFKADTLNESMFKLCNQVDNGSLAFDFCVMTESILYSLDLLFSDVDNRAIMEGVIDYYLEKYNENVPAFISTIRECIEIDPFIPNEASDYIDYIEYIDSNQDLLVEQTINHFNNSRYAFIQDYNDLMKENYYNALNEFAIFDKAKEIMTKFKTLRHKSVATLKNAIDAIFVTNRLQDIKANTRNSLALCYYFFFTALMTYSLGPIGVVLGLILSLTLSAGINKEYLQESLEAWHEHKYMVERKIKNSDDNEEKHRLTKYLEEIDKNIEVLEKKYEECRDETGSEIRERTIRKTHSDDYDHGRGLLDPDGNDPDLDKYNDTEKEELKNG